MIKRIFLTIALILLPILTLAGAQPQFQQGKQYKLVTVSPTSPVKIEVPKGKVSVTEFFSYGCPWCFHLEPTLEKWLKTKPSYVEFERVPVIFESGWQVYSKAYYSAKSLGILDKITPALFNAIHKKGLNLTSEPAMEKFFLSQGVSKQDFEGAFNFSPGIGVELQRANALMMAYKVFEVPTIIVNGKYLVNSKMTNGNDEKMMQVVSYLVKKEREAK